MTANQKHKWILPIIVIAQFACTSLWFAGNAVLTDIIGKTTSSSLGNITSAVQFGFITGTFVFAIFTISDRFSPSKVFFVCACLAALTNLIIFSEQSFFTIGLSRFATGFFLAGIYPVGMKIASDYHDKGLGKALGYLVGALVLGTAFPHLMKTFTEGLSWKYVIVATSFLSIIGGGLIYFFVPDGPYRTKGTKPDFGAFYQNFKRKHFRAAAFGYFGHMWELYAFWAFVPVIFSAYKNENPTTEYNNPFMAFTTIAIGFASCIAGGYISQNHGSAKTAFGALLVSCICCLISPIIFQMPYALFLFIILIWGAAVVADSPQFSTLVAQQAYAESKGTAMTIVNCIGFSITIVSIQLLNILSQYIHPHYIYLVLAIGPFAGLLSMRQLVKPHTNSLN